MIYIRKKICSRCGAIIKETEKCQCKIVVNTRSNNDNKVKDMIYSKEWRSKRLQIIKRDQYVCQRCFIKYNIINSEELTVHHILSRRDYPNLMFEDSNLVCICSTCNKQLGTKNKLDFEWDNSKSTEINEVNL